METAVAAGGVRKGNAVEGRRHLQDLLEDELVTVNGNFKKLDCVASNPDKVRLFAASNTDGGDSSNQLIVGKKRARGGDLAANDSDIDNEEDSLVTDKDMAELGDEDFFYKGGKAALGGASYAAKDSSVLL